MPFEIKSKHARWQRSVGVIHIGEADEKYQTSTELPRIKKNRVKKAKETFKNMPERVLKMVEVPWRDEVFLYCFKTPYDGADKPWKSVFWVLTNKEHRILESFYFIDRHSQVEMGKAIVAKRSNTVYLTGDLADAGVPETFITGDGSSQLTVDAATELLNHLRGTTNE